MEFDLKDLVIIQDSLIEYRHTLRLYRNSLKENIKNVGNININALVISGLQTKIDNITRVLSMKILKDMEP